MGLPPQPSLVDGRLVPMTQTILASLRIAPPSKAPVEIHGEYREVDNHDPDGAHWVRLVGRALDLDEKTPEEAINIIRLTADELSRCTIERDRWEEWGESGEFLVLKGERPVTDEEQQWIAVGIAAATQRKRDQASYVNCPRCQIRHLPPEHPMLEILDS